jgi:1-phosphofructokinase
MNPCIDKTITIDAFEYGGLNRVKSSRRDIGGKGINVAAVYTNLGGEAQCTGINYQTGGDFILNRLDEMHIRHEFVTAPGELRENLKVFDPSRAVVTEFNESGWPVGAEQVTAVKNKVRILSQESGIMVFSGSVPKGVSFAVYRELMQECDASRCRMVLDAEGQLFLEGLKAQPYLVKPNRFELEKALGMELNTYEETASGARRILDYGVQIVCVSLGSDGALIVDKKDAWFAPALPVQVKSTVGAGDSMVAALCLAIEQGRPLDEMLRMASAAAAASVMTAGTLLCSRQDFDALLPQAAAIHLNDVTFVE